MSQPYILTLDAVRGRLLQVVAPLPSDCYVLEEQEDHSGVVGVGRIFRLRSRDRVETTAQLTVYWYPDPDELVVEVGVASRFEIPARGRWRPFELPCALDELEAVATAVVNGRVVERLWTGSDGITKSEITIWIGGRRFTGSTHNVGRAGNGVESVREYESFAAACK